MDGESITTPFGRTLHLTPAGHSYIAAFVTAAKPARNTPIARSRL